MNSFSFHVQSPCSASVQLRMTSLDRHNISPFLYKKPLNLKPDSNDHRNCNYVQSSALHSLSLSLLLALFLSFFCFLFLKKKDHKDVQALERLMLCQFSFRVIPIHHSDLGDACPIVASALIHCPPVTRADDHC